MTGDHCLYGHLKPTQSFEQHHTKIHRIAASIYRGNNLLFYAITLFWNRYQPAEPSNLLFYFTFHTSNRYTAVSSLSTTLPRMFPGRESDTNF